MSSRDDLTDDVVAALNPYFSTSVAKALIVSTLRRASVEPRKLDANLIAILVPALERTLPSYITDEARRGECVLRLRRLREMPGAAQRPLPATPARATEGSGSPPPQSSPAAPPSTVIHIRVHQDVVNASEITRDITRKIGFSLVDQTKIATATSELARNILLYASIGELRIASIGAPRKAIEIAADDEGPGIRDLDLVLSGRYRSRTGMGMGLRGTKRLMDVFEITTAPGKGTHVVARKFLP